MNAEDVKLCIEAGVHMVGFVVDYPLPVPWNLSAAQAGELIARVPSTVNSCVVTGGTVAKVLDLVQKTHPNIVQLHDQETLEDIIKIARQLKNQGVQTIKALRIDASGKCDFEIPDPAPAARELAQTGVAAILVDSHHTSRPGGTGVRVDLATFRIIQQESSLPVILAGGLTPTNIASAIQETHPYAVDVLTGIEEKPGRKDPEKIRRFMREIRVNHPSCEH